MSNRVSDTAASAVQARNRIRDYVYQTPLIPARYVGKDNQSVVLFKAENFQITGSFKIRGAMSKLSLQSSDVRMITASSGNHGISAACAAEKVSSDSRHPEDCRMSKAREDPGIRCARNSARHRYWIS